MTPKCTQTRHKWTRKGGCHDNPGVWGIGGAAVLTRETCAHCGTTRERVRGDVDTPSRNHGWRYEPAHHLTAALAVLEAGDG